MFCSIPRLFVCLRMRMSSSQQYANDIREIMLFALYCAKELIMLFALYCAKEPKFSNESTIPGRNPTVSLLLIFHKTLLLSSTILPLK